MRIVLASVLVVKNHEILCFEVDIEVQNTVFTIYWCNEDVLTTAVHVKILKVKVSFTDELSFLAACKLATYLLHIK